MVIRSAEAMPQTRLLDDGETEGPPIEFGQDGWDYRFELWRVAYDGVPLSDQDIADAISALARDGRIRTMRARTGAGGGAWFCVIDAI